MKNTMSLSKTLHIVALFITTFLGVAVQNPWVVMFLVIVSVLLLMSYINNDNHNEQF